VARRPAHRGYEAPGLDGLMAQLSLFAISLNRIFIS